MLPMAASNAGENDSEGRGQVMAAHELKSMLRLRPGGERKQKQGRLGALTVDREGFWLHQKCITPKILVYGSHGACTLPMNAQWRQQ